MNEIKFIKCNNIDEISSVLKYVIDDNTKKKIYPFYRTNVDVSIFEDISKHKISIINYDDFANIENLNNDDNDKKDIMTNGKKIYLDRITESETSFQDDYNAFCNIGSQNLLNTEYFKMDKVVICFDNEKFIIPALLYSILNKVPLFILDDISDLDKIDKKSFKYLVFFGNPEIFTYSFINTIENIVSSINSMRKNFSKASYGIMTGRNFNETLNLVIKTDLYNLNKFNSYVIYNSVDNLIHREIGGEKLIIDSKCSLDTFEANNKEIIGVFNIVAHGRDCCIHLSDAVICGKSNKYKHKVENESLLPGCSTDGLCYRKKFNGPNVIDASKIKSPIIFSNSCSTLKISKALVEIEYSISLNALDGYSIAYVGSSLVKGTNTWVNYLFNYLIKVGKSLGEACNIVNSCIRAQEKDFPCFKIIGDPSYRLYDEEFIDDKVRINTYTDNNGMRIEVLNNESSFVNISIGDSLIYKKYLVKQFVIDYIGSKSKCPVFYNIYPDEVNKELSIFIYSSEKLPEEFEIVVNFEEDNLFLENKFITNIENLNYINIPTQPIKNLINDVNFVAKSLIKYKNNSLYNLQYRKKFMKKKQEFYNISSNIQNSIVERLSSITNNGWYSFTENNEEEFITTDYRMQGKCYICNEDTNIQRIRHLFNEHIIREITICPNCGHIFDNDSDELKICILGESKLQKGYKYEQELFIKNTTKKTIRGVLELAQVNSKAFGIKFENARVEFILKPNEIFSYNVNVDITNPIINQDIYWLRAYGIIDGKIYVSSKNIWVKN
ncbi:hypothetical protein [Clostridium cellulovorans]|uniref:Uncharacterized protein n=1 Tax=Clostridium cellulovorans (strain ATCC 35296 / DSM 3052 / OCM 3 / 743B) TaxID=573061 RepID=D9SU77_CLOC7|nr:hypothetical protein [Clostridium cellulovorans]ADL52832.1 hypothetical protein Clocel_3145 [Clostridium cellulovorans 743B]